MKSFIAALRSLVLPYGRTSGQRIVLDGDNGQIAVYDATGTLAVLIQSASPAGITVYGPDGTISLANADAVWQSGDGSRVEIIAGAAQALQMLNPPDRVGVTWDEGSIGTQVDSTFGTNTPSVFMGSPQTHGQTNKAQVQVYGPSPTQNRSMVRLIGDLTQSFGDHQVLGALTAANIQSGSFSITPTVAGQWTSNAVITFPNPFVNTPVVMVTPSGNGPGTGSTTQLEFQTTGVTTTGFNCRIRRDNLSATALSWLAVST